MIFKQLLQFLKHTNTKTSHSNKMETTQFNILSRNFQLTSRFSLNKVLEIRLSITGGYFGILFAVLSALHCSIPVDLWTIILLALILRVLGLTLFKHSDKSGNLISQRFYLKNIFFDSGKISAKPGKFFSGLTMYFLYKFQFEGNLCNKTIKKFLDIFSHLHVIRKISNFHCNIFEIG